MSKKILQINIDVLVNGEKLLDVEPGYKWSMGQQVKDYYKDPNSFKILNHNIGFVKNQHGFYVCLKEV